MRSSVRGFLAILLGSAFHLFTPAASANTFTFTYSGADYTGYGASNLSRSGLNYPFTQADINGWANNLGPNMNVTVTIDFVFGDMSNVTGTFLLNDLENRGGAPDHSNDYVGTMSFVSGLANGSFGSFFADSITLVNGNVTDWNFDLFVPSSRSCGGAPIVQYCEFQSSPSGGDHVHSYTGYTGAFFGADVDVAGSWSAVPGPTIGTGIPGLVLASGAILAWRRRRAAPLSL